MMASNRLDENETSEDFKRRRLMEKGSFSKDPLSPLEAIPQELIWMIIEQVPEALRLRLISRALRCHVDEYAASRKNCVVKLKIFESIQDIPQDKLRLLITRKIDDEILFKLRMKLSSPNLQRLHIIKCEKGTITYLAFLNELIENCISMETIGQFLGRRIEKLTLSISPNPYMMERIPKLLAGMVFKQLKFEIRTVSDDCKNRLIDMINDHNVETFSLFTNEIVSSDPAGFLLELSSLVRGLRIYQEYAYGIPNGQNYLLGAENVHWAPIFIEMLTRKLDKLWIQNSQYCEYLSYHDVEILKEKLLLLEKNIWFDASISRNFFFRTQNEHNGCIVKAGSSMYTTQLEVKHKSRENEFFEH